MPDEMRMQGEVAGDRVVWALTGKDVLDFLQGLVSNDVLPLARGPGAVWAALLTPQGKYLADFLIVAPPCGPAGTYLIDIAAALAEATLRRLTMYRLRADVTIAPAGLTVLRGLGPAPAGALPDPRHPALGWRAWVEAGTVVAAPPTIGGPAIDWDALRVTHVIPEYGAELIPDDSYLLEMGFERLHGVDFRKGCYVGQEVTARMKHKTELRKGLVQVLVAGAAPIGTEIRAGDKVVGRLFTQSGGRGLAHLRFDQAVGAMQAGAAGITLPPA